MQLWEEFSLSLHFQILERLFVHSYWPIPAIILVLLYALLNTEGVQYLNLNNLKYLFRFQRSAGMATDATSR